MQPFKSGRWDLRRNNAVYIHLCRGIKCIFLTANVIMLLAYLSPCSLFSFSYPPRGLTWSLSLSLSCALCFLSELNFVYLRLIYLFLYAFFWCWNQTRFSRLVGIILRYGKNNARYLSLIATELFKHANFLRVYTCVCFFLVFISITAWLHWCGITEEIKVDIVSSFLYPPQPPVSSFSALLSVVFYISVFFLEVAAALSHYVSTSCVSVVIMPAGTVLSLPLSAVSAVSLCLSLGGWGAL